MRSGAPPYPELRGASLTEGPCGIPRGRVAGEIGMSEKRQCGCGTDMGRGFGMAGGGESVTEADESDGVGIEMGGARTTRSWERRSCWPLTSTTTVSGVTETTRNGRSATGERLCRFSRSEL